ncbi:MAG: hypothetical protein JNM74_06610 [Myxococcales bacterium]|nr:hypothetical protein [Myxococcales bacterium]
MSHVVSMAADAVDVAPKRVREVLRAVAQASAEAGIPLEVLARMVAAEAERG